jgi:hypothetical protein
VEQTIFQVALGMAYHRLAIIVAGSVLEAFLIWVTIGPSISVEETMNTFKQQVKFRLIRFAMKVAKNFGMHEVLFEKTKRHLGPVPTVIEVRRVSARKG